LRALIFLVLNFCVGCIVLLTRWKICCNHWIFLECHCLVWQALTSIWWILNLFFFTGWYKFICFLSWVFFPFWIIYLWVWKTVTWACGSTGTTTTSATTRARYVTPNGEASNWLPMGNCDDIESTKCEKILSKFQCRFLPKKSLRCEGSYITFVKQIWCSLRNG